METLTNVSFSELVASAVLEVGQNGRLEFWATGPVEQLWGSRLADSPVSGVSLSVPGFSTIRLWQLRAAASATTGD